MESDLDDFDQTLLEGALKTTKKNGKSKKSLESVGAIKERYDSFHQPTSQKVYIAASDAKLVNNPWHSALF